MSRGTNCASRVRRFRHVSGCSPCLLANFGQCSRLPLNASVLSGAHNGVQWMLRDSSAPCQGSLCSCARWLGRSFFLLESCFCLTVFTDEDSEIKFKPCTGASLHQRRRLNRNFIFFKKIMGGCSPSSLRRKVLMEVLTDAISAYLVANAGRAFVSSSSCCHGPAGLTEPDPCQQLISDASLMAFKRRRKTKGKGMVGWDVEEDDGMF